MRYTVGTSISVQGQSFSRSPQASTSSRSIATECIIADTTRPMLVLRGGNPYDYGPLVLVLEEIAGFQSNNLYFYPPWYVLPFLQPAFLSVDVARGLWLAFNLRMFYMSLEWIRYTLDWDIAGWRLWLTSTPVNNHVAGF